MSMPKSYKDQLKESGIVSNMETLYLIQWNPCDYPYQYDQTDSFISSIPKSVFELYYCLQSFENLTDDNKYVLYFITNQGVFVEESIRSQNDYRIDFTSVRARHFCDITRESLVINLPNTRKLLFLRDIRMLEEIDGKVLPPSYNSIDMQIESKFSHTLTISSSNWEPLTFPFNRELYENIKRRCFYMDIRPDNYVDMERITLWRHNY